MKKTKLLISLALVLMFTMILGQSITFAQDAPPAIDSPFGDDDDDDTPPALTGGEDDEPPVLTGGETEPPEEEDPPLPPPPDDNDGKIPDSGPEMAFLLIPSLALGYAYRKNKNRK